MIYTYVFKLKNHKSAPYLQIFLRKSAGKKIVCFLPLIFT